MAEAELKEGIKLEQVESDGCCEPECGPTTCGSVEEKSEKVLPVIAGGSGDGCCEPDCSPETCG